MNFLATLRVMYGKAEPFRDRRSRWHNKKAKPFMPPFPPAHFLVGAVPTVCTAGYKYVVGFAD
jgi:hypothetical protein